MAESRNVHFYYLKEDERSWFFMNVQSGEVIQRTKFADTKFPVTYVEGRDTRILHGVEDSQVTDLVQVVEVKQSEAGEPVPAEAGNPDSVNCKWTENMCLLLISLYQKLKPKVGSVRVPSFRKMWALMAATFEQKGHLLKWQQLEMKWKTMERAYKNAQTNKIKTGRGRKNCPFEKELHEILGPLYSQPVEVKESHSKAGTSRRQRAGLARTKNLTHSDSDSSEDEETPVPRHSARSTTATTSTRNKRNRSPSYDSIVKEVQLFRHDAEARSLKKEEQRERRHAEKMVKLDDLMELLRANCNK